MYYTLKLVVHVIFLLMRTTGLSLDGCPGKYCGRLLQNSTHCEPTCGVNNNIFALFVMFLQMNFVLGLSNWISIISR